MPAALPQPPHRPAATTRASRLARPRWLLAVASLVAGVAAPPGAAQAHAQAAAPTLSLTEARAWLQSHSVERQVQLSAVEQAAILQDSADAFLYPSLHLNGQLTLNDSEQTLEFGNPYTPLAPYLQAVYEAAPALNTNPAVPTPEQLTGSTGGSSVVQPRWDYRASLTVTQTVFNARAFPGLRIAERLHDLARASEAGLAYGLLEAVDSLYFQALSLKRTVTIMERNVEVNRQQRDRARIALEGAVGSRFVATRTETQLRAAERQLQAARLAQQRTMEALAALLRRPVDFDVAEPPDLPAPPERSALMAQAEAQRPEVAAVQSGVAVEEARVDEGRGQLWPTLIAQLQGNLQQTTAFSDDAFRWNAALIFDWELFDGGIRSSDVERRERAVQQARLRTEAERERVRAEVESAYTGWERGAALCAAASEEAGVARDNLAQTEQALSLGTASQLDVDAARTQLLVAELAVAQAESDRLAALYALYRAAGAAR